MLTFLFALFLLLVAVGAVVIRKTYDNVPLAELKRRAEKHDPVAAELYRAAAYGSSLRSLLTMIIVVCSAAGVVLLTRNVPLWFSLVAVLVLLWAAFSWLPASRVTSLGARLAVTVTPALAWLLNYLHGPLNRSVNMISKRYNRPAHTGLFERDDLLHLIERQRKQADSRFTDEELEIAQRALSFSDYKVRDVLTPRKEVKTVLAGDVISPILIDEIHRSGQLRILVRESAKGAFVGTLLTSRVGLKSTGKVADDMDPHVYYVHENDSLGEALHAFFVTNHPMFVVVNSFEEFVGVISVESVLKQLLGHVPGDDFDQYSDPAAVANKYPIDKHTVKATDADK